MQEILKNDFNDNLTEEVVSSVRLKGELTDEIRDKKASTSNIVDQGHNMIVLGCHNLIAGLVGGIANSSEQLYFAIGNSNKEVSAGDDALDNFLFKIPIKQQDITINNNILSITVEFPDVAPDGIDDAVYNTIWRECAIFKGDNMLNRKIHSDIEKTQDIILSRTFKFTF